MSMWSDIDSLRSLSHGLMWATAIFGVLAATTTGIRYYVDRRASELISVARNAELELKEKAQREREAALQAKIETAEREQGEANTKLTKIEEKAKPRTFTNSQEKQFIAAVSGCSSKLVSLTAPLGDPEAISFANYLDSLFKVAGWTTKGVSQAVFTGIPLGIILRVNSKQQLHPCMVSLQKTLYELGFQAPGDVVPGTPVDAIDIVVGHKP
jgi:hypothetical protein